MKVGHLEFSVYAQNPLSINDLNLAVQNQCLPGDIESIILAGVYPDKGTLLLAVKHHVVVVKLLISYGVKPDNDILDIAICNNNPPNFVRFLINIIEEIPTESVLFGAVTKGYGRYIITLLIKGGAIVSNRTLTYAKAHRSDLCGLFPENKL